MWLDNVVLRVGDTRVYMDFEEKETSRVYTETGQEYERVTWRLTGRRGVSNVMRDVIQITCNTAEG